jgi:putative acetyltransferase
MHAPPPQFTLRPYEPADAARIARLYFDSARRLGARRYSAEQVAAWAPAPQEPDQVHARAADGRTTLVAAAPDGAVLAYGDLEADGHIDHLYCRPEAAGTGVAAAVLDALIAQAQAKGLTRLYVEASELARGLFERKGFRVLHRRDFELRGVAIHNYAMERVAG